MGGAVGTNIIMLLFSNFVILNSRARSLHR